MLRRLFFRVGVTSVDSTVQGSVVHVTARAASRRRDSSSPPPGSARAGSRPAPSAPPARPRRRAPFSRAPRSPGRARKRALPQRRLEARIPVKAGVCPDRVHGKSRRIADWQTPTVDVANGRIADLPGSPWEGAESCTKRAFLSAAPGRRRARKPSRTGLLCNLCEQPLRLRDLRHFGRRRKAFERRREDGVGFDGAAGRLVEILRARARCPGRSCGSPAALRRR